MKEQNSLGQWLKEKCKNEHLSLRQAAAKAGLSHQTIAGIIAGNRPLPETIGKLARGFGGNGTQRLALENHLFALSYRGRPEKEISKQGYLGIMPLLSPQHQHILEVVVGELAKIEGIEMPPLIRRIKQKNGMLTTSDVAHLLSTHVNTVRRWSDHGLLKVYRIGPRGDRRFKRKDIDSFLQEHGVGFRKGGS